MSKSQTDVSAAEAVELQAVPAGVALGETHQDSTQDHADGDVDVEQGLRNPEDPLNLSQYKKTDVTRKSIKGEYPRGPHRQLESYYVSQNEMIDGFLNSDKEERLDALDKAKNGWKVNLAVNASFGVNACLFVIQLYAAISTGSLALFATAADAFMDLVSSIIMLITSHLAARANFAKYPVGRKRIETVGVILFCALMTTVAIELIIESARSLGSGHGDSSSLQVVPLVCVGIAIGAKFCLFCYCLTLRRYPAAHVFFIDHRNDLVVNTFGLIMSIVGREYVWYLDPVGAMCIALLILYSWISTAFENVWLLVGKSAPQNFINKCIYMAVTHDPRIEKVDTCRAYHSGEKFYVEVDIVMSPTTMLRDSHDVGQTLQRKYEGLADVERAFVHIDYEHEHDVFEEHKPLYMREKPQTLFQVIRNLVSGSAKTD